MEIRPIFSALLRSKTGGVLIAAQVALTLAIVSNAAFIVSNRLTEAERPSGVDEANVFELTFVHARTIEDRVAMTQKDLETLRAIPGVVSASTINQVPLGQSGWQTGFLTDKSRPGDGRSVGMYMSDASLIDTLGLRIIDGRNFEPSEILEVDARKSDRSASHMIVTRSYAKALFPDATSVVGKVVYDGVEADATELRIVGVVDRLVTPWAAGTEAYDSAILPIRYLGGRSQYLVRTEPGQRARVQAAAEQALGALRNDRVRTQNRTMDEVREQRYRNARTGVGMLMAVSIGLLLVTGSGIVGVASLWVSQRRKQIGVRRALGAGRIDILRYFVTENLIITTVGVALGVGLSIGLNLFLVSKLELARLPVVFIAGSVAGLWALGIVAVLGPAWRAAAVPPAIATRGA
jgi:putative ABC transport system permease protein